MGIAAAAKALGLDFIPFAQERYDLVIPRVFYESELLQPLLAIIRGGGFARSVDALSGYDTSSMGIVMAELG
jgi:putative molybdopterin biosynthesis protein